MDVTKLKLNAISFIQQLYSLSLTPQTYTNPECIFYCNTINFTSFMGAYMVIFPLFFTKNNTSNEIQHSNLTHSLDCARQ